MLKEWITGREKRQIDSILLRNVEMKQRGTDQEISGFNSQLLEESENMALSVIVVSVDGSASDVVNNILDMPARDYEAVVKAVREIKDGTTEETKKK